ncbi:MAG: carboxymuconolactone decarboxylase family protein [Bacteroidetes bacterium]|nr:carboxymuconolactone decarboxylase family protein [Bacteroidota bacterium]
MSTRLDYYQFNPRAVDLLRSMSKHLGSIDHRLRALVELRASQINGCVYCLDLHATQAREHGETQQRLDCLSAWDECPFFDERERAALAWTESLTNVSATHAPDDLYARLHEHFTEQEIVDLTMIISVINAWNRLAIGLRKMPAPRG